MIVHEIYKALLLILSAVISFLLISVVLRGILLYVNPGLRQKRNLTVKVQSKDVGTWIGLCEFVLILLFVFLHEYTAIAIVFAAKEIVRSGEVREDPSYYLLGTLLNVSLSILFALILKFQAGALFS